MRITKETDALSLAAIAKVETERRRFLKAFYQHGGDGGLYVYIESMRDFDVLASEALTQSLADAVCSEYVEIV